MKKIIIITSFIFALTITSCKKETLVQPINVTNTTADCHKRCLDTINLNVYLFDYDSADNVAMTGSSAGSNTNHFENIYVITKSLGATIDSIYLGNSTDVGGNTVVCHPNNMTNFLASSFVPSDVFSFCYDNSLRLAIDKNNKTTMEIHGFNSNPPTPHAVHLATFAVAETGVYNSEGSPSSTSFSFPANMQQVPYSSFSTLTLY